MLTELQNELSFLIASGEYEWLKTKIYCASGTNDECRANSYARHSFSLSNCRFFSQLLCVMQSHQKCLGLVESNATPMNIQQNTCQPGQTNNEYLLQHWCRQRFDTMPKSHFRPMFLLWVIFQVWMNKCDSVKNDYNLYNLIMSIMAWNLCLSFHISIYFIEQLAFILIIWTCMRMLTGKYLCLYLYLFIHHKRLFDLF